MTRTDCAYGGSEDEVTKGYLAKGYFQDKDKGYGVLKQNKVRCILTVNRTFQQGIVSDHCAVHTCANDHIVQSVLPVTDQAADVTL